MGPLHAVHHHKICALTQVLDYGLLVVPKDHGVNRVNNIDSTGLDRPRPSAGMQHGARTRRR